MVVAHERASERLATLVAAVVAAQMLTRRARAMSRAKTARLKVDDSPSSRIDSQQVARAIQLGHKARAFARAPPNERERRRIDLACERILCI